MPIKKLKPQKSVLEINLVPVQSDGSSTNFIETLDKRNNDERIREIYNNKEQVWRTLAKETVSELEPEIDEKSKEKSGSHATKNDPENSTAKEKNDPKGDSGK